MDSLSYDVFVSYARRDDAGGWVSALCKAIYDDFKSFSTEPFRIFFDRSEIHTRDDWELRLRQGLRSSRVLLVCLSPNYLKSQYCRWEWEEFTRLQARRIGGGDAVTGVFFVELGDDQQYGADLAAWRRQLERVQLEQLQPWFPQGVTALQRAEVRRRVEALGQGVYEHWRQARLAKQAPGNLVHHNPNFVGRVEELRELRTQLTGGAVGVVTAVHGIGGMGKTELVLTYAHAYADRYQGGTWWVDADGQSDLLEAISALARSPALGLQVAEEDRRDRNLVGQLVVAQLAKRTAAARESDEATGACFLLLDNVSEPGLLSEAQLALLPQEPWFHVAATTRLGVGDIGAVGARGSVALIGVDRLGTQDGVELLREHQPARDPAKLNPDFSSPLEADEARALVELLDGYTLAIEQAAVYLGSFGIEPSQLLALLQAQGPALLDAVGANQKAAGAIRHKEKLAGVIVDQTLHRLTNRARAALGFASLLPPDSIPWQWLQQLTEPADGATPAVSLPGLSDDDWPATRRLLEGRRLLTPGDDRQRFARLHRVLQAHLRPRLADDDTEQRLDTQLQQVSQNLRDDAKPDTALLAVTAATLTSRLAEGRDDLAPSARKVLPKVQQRLGLGTAGNLAAAALQTSERLVGSEPDNADYQHGLSVSLERIGDIRVVRGDTTGALQAYSRALEIRERRADANPDNSDYQHDLGVSLDNVADVRAEHGDPDGALQACTRSLEIHERLAGADPDNSRHQRALSSVLYRAGYLRVALGDPKGALQAYTRAMGILERLASADPDNTKDQRDLSATLYRVGDLLLARGDVDAALAAHARCLDIVERLARADPDNTDYQRDLTISLVKAGELRVWRGDTSAALEAYNRSLDIAERLARADPDNVELQRDVAVSLNSLGNVQAGDGETDAALENYTRALQIAERLASADPTNSQYQADVAVNLERVGDQRATGGDIDGALTAYTRAQPLYERLANANPDNPLYRQLLLISLYRLGDLRAASGDTDAAVAAHTRALEIAERLARTDPVNPEYQRNLALCLAQGGTLRVARGELASALQPFSRALDIVERLSVADPASPQYRNDLLFYLNSLGDVRRDCGDPEGALQAYTRSVEILERVAQGGPGNSQHQRDLRVSLDKVGAVSLAHGDAGGALDAYTRSAEIAAQMAETAPDNTEYQYDLAISLIQLGDLWAAAGYVGAVEAYTHSLGIADWLAGNDPDNAQYQRHVYVSAYKLALLLESADDPSAFDHWSKAHQVLTALDAAGKLDEADRPFLEILTQKLRAKRRRRS